MSKDVALWGYGACGKWLYQNISREWRKEYRITAVFDKALCGSKTSDGHLILDPVHISEYYKAGLFAEVLPGVAVQKVRDTILNSLRKLDIPLCVPDNHAAFHPAADFAPDKPCFSSEIPFGYCVQEIKNLVFARPFHDQKCFLYNDRGFVLSDIFYDYEIMQEPVIHSFRPDHIQKELPELAGEYCLLTHCYGKNYWHFVFQSMDQAWILEKHGYQGKYILPINSPFAEPLMNLIGVGADRLVDAMTLSLKYPQGCRLENTFIVNQTELNYDPQIAAPILEEMAQFILSHLELEPSTEYPSRIFVERKSSRRLINAEKILKKYGFKTIVPDELSVEKQIKYFHGARIVISPHGANSANSLFMQSGSVLVESFPNNYIQPLCLETTIIRGVHYLQVAESRTQVRFPKYPKDPSDYYADYEIDKTLLEHAILNAIKLAE